MAEDPNTKIVPWNNQEPDNKNLEALSVLITQLVDKIKALDSQVNP